jgi:hypothetical protein
MPRFVFSDPIEITPEDVVSTETEIRVGSVVVFERRTKYEVVFRALSGQELYELPGKKYLVSKGKQSGDIDFSIWKPAEKT